MSSEYVKRATVQVATDASMAYVLSLLGSETRQKVIDLIVPALADYPDVTDAAIAAAVAAVDEAIADRNIVESAITVTTDDAVTGLVDRDGKRLPGAQWDEFGRPSITTMKTFQNRGMLRSDEGILRAVAFKDAIGARTWMSVEPDGGFDHTTYTYLVNRLHFAVGSVEPFVYPGNYVYWVDVNDPDLTIYRLDN